MIWPNWKKEYTKIVRMLDLDNKADYQASTKLEEYLLDLSSNRRDSIIRLLKDILHYPVVIAGAGPSLETDFNYFYKSNHVDKVRFIAVDGATALFHQKNIVPSIVITDLDGDLASIQWSIVNGSVVLIHAHGDNQIHVEKFFQDHLKIIKQNWVWGTTQCKTDQILFNFGGFTDGDRAIILSFYFQTPLIGLIGFDFGNKIGKFSQFNSPIEKQLNRKLIKFQIALNLIKIYYRYHNGIRFNLTSHGQEIDGFPRIKFPDFLIQLDLLYK